MIRSAILAVVLVVAGAPTLAADSNPMRERWNEPKAPFQIVGNTWFVGTQGLSVLLIRGDKGSVLLDAGLPESIERIRTSLAALDVDPTEIKLILTSHAHFDHVGGLAQLKALTGARVLASADSATQLAAGGKGDLHFGDSGPFAPVVVDATIADNESVSVGNLTLTARFTPGHTPGSTSWTWKTQDQGRTVHVVYADSMTAPGYRLLDHPQRPNLVDEFRRSFARLTNMDCDVLITPHPDASDLFQRMQSAGADAAAKSKVPALIDSTGCLRYAAKAARAVDARVAQQRAGSNAEQE